MWSVRRVLVGAVLVLGGACGEVVTAQPDAQPDAVPDAPPDAPPDAAPRVASLAIDPAMTVVVIGIPTKLTATATYDDGTMVDVTGTAMWSSDAEPRATVSGGQVTGVGPGSATITATIDGVSATAIVTVRAPNLVVASFSGSSLAFFPLDATGDVAPLRRITGAATGLNTPRSIAVSDGEVFAVNQGGGSVTVYLVTDSGNVAPLRQLTGLTTPSGIALSDTEMFVSEQGNTIKVFTLTASGSGFVPTSVTAPLPPTPGSPG